ncbi:hypothetical protein FJTKL_06332 [Diaporthe vaccinii]|uniref:Uncharacterized protein n=1 Tax=Diaporthe vaccinii TaxID=105482 RepID=A0ABR4DSM9_9PEZI
MDTPIATGCSGTSPSVNVLSPVADNPATHQLPPVAESAEELLFELQRSADQRFRWITLFLEDFREWTSRRQVWDEKVKATLRQYCEAGWPEAADELSAALLSKPYVTRPGTFKLQWHTGYGQERVTIFFEGSESDDDEKSRRLSRSGSDLSQSVDPDSESDRASSAPQLTVEPPSKDRSCNQCQAAHQRCDRSRPPAAQHGAKGGATGEQTPSFQDTERGDHNEDQCRLPSPDADRAEKYMQGAGNKFGRCAKAWGEKVDARGACGQ